MIKNVILDFDGTFTDLSVGLDSFFYRWDSVVAEKANIPLEGLMSSVAVYEEKVRQDQVRAWEMDGFPVAPASADPYLVHSVALMDFYDESLEASAKAGLDKKAFGKLLSEGFRAAHQGYETEFRPEAKRFMDSLTKVCSVAVVTNSQPDSVREKLKLLGQYNITLVGDAKKFSVDKTLVDLPMIAQFPGFPRPVYLRRRHYKECLDGLDLKHGFTPKETAVVGDIFELDLALPQFLGYRTLLLQTPGAKDYEIKYMKNMYNSYAPKDLLEALRDIQG